MKIKKNTIYDNKPTFKFNQPISEFTSLILFSMFSLSSSSSSSSSSPHQLKRPPPIPIMPIPTSRQLSWQLSEMALFLHFGPNTFTDSEWGTGHADPSIFNPSALDATQWVRVAKENGFSRIILTAKHHDGFCLWPSLYTDYSVRSSPWKNGNGDVVAELAEAAHSAGVQLGLYLSPWDRHEPCYGKTLEYNEFYMGQMTELLTRYAKGGDPFGHDWVPAECDVSIRPGWFWHASELPKSAQTILDKYYKSVGRNCLLLLNVPPNSSGLISNEDIQVLQEFTELRASIFSQNLAKNALISASSTRQGINDSQFDSRNVLEEGMYSYWASEENQSDWMLYLEFQDPVTFNVLHVQEPIQMGQRVVEFHLDSLNEKGQWKEVTNGTTVGHKRLLRFPTVVSNQLRFVIVKSRADPLISYLAIHMDLVSTLNVSHTSNSSSYFNRSQVLQQITRNHSQIVSMSS
ncbi:alpha-L-fucosidase 1 isoform X2 [Camellia sinensis]|uniref:alpha-L-fucosidase 1 isoform X2 n=1 Tax=Camellia sinensis TaxID=4442 RepID=UPI0010357074|nr:alpha-L-fucosidase 1 isoform X2 [Camellia sinensis]